MPRVSFINYRPMSEPFDYDQDDAWEGSLAFDFGRFVYNFFAAHFIPPKTTAQRVARLTAIPSILLGLASLVLLIQFPPLFAMQGVACLVGLVWFCYSAWAAYTVEQTYVKDLEAAQREEL